jgi:hypothetical protein
MRDALLLEHEDDRDPMFIIVLVGTLAAPFWPGRDFRGSGSWTPWWTYQRPTTVGGGHRASCSPSDGSASGSYFDASATISFHNRRGRDGRDLVAAHFYVRQASIGFAGVTRREEAAMVDGAGRFVFTRVTVPLAFPALSWRWLTAGAGVGRVRGDHYLRRQLQGE